jgi:mono/diheme cytochrome c family protein
MNRIAKGGFAAVGGLVGLLMISAAAIYGVSGSHLNRTFEVETPALTIPTDSASVAHGAHLLASRGCMDCHAENLGGAIFIEDPAMGRLVASNLTAGAGGVGSMFAPEDWDRAIRHGVGPGGRALLFMPAYEYNHFSDEDIAAMIAYLRTVTPVDNELPGNRVGPLARALYLKGDLPLLPAMMIDHTPRERVAPEPGPTVEYGAYVAPGCIGCHGANYSGGAIPGVPPDWPPSANITMHESGLQGWTLEDFHRALKEGVRPDGTELREPYMPISVTKHLHDFEIEALWRYLQTVEPRPAGNR